MAESLARNHNLEWNDDLNNHNFQILVLSSLCGLLSPLAFLAFEVSTTSLSRNHNIGWNDDVNNHKYQTNNV